MEHLIQKEKSNLTLSLSDKIATKSALLASIKEQTLLDIATNATKPETLMGYLKLQSSVSLDRLVSEPTKSIRDAIRAIGLLEVQKLIILAVKYFADGLQVQNKLAAFDMLEFSHLFIEKYQYDSYDDLVCALKNAKLNGKKFYNQFGTQELFEILAEHFEQKAQAMENKHVETKYKNAVSVFSAFEKSESKEVQELVSKLITDTYRKKEKAKEKSRDLFDEIAELEALYASDDKSLQDCYKFKQYCKMRGLDIQEQMIDKIIAQKRLN